MYLGAMRSLIRSPAVAAAATPPTLTYIGTVVTDAVGSPGSAQTATAAAIGAADANRRVIVAIGVIVRYDAITNITIGGGGTFVGNFLSHSGAGSFGGQTAYGYADIAAGTTADIVMTGGGEAGTGQWVAHVFTVDKSLIIDASPTTASTAIASAGTTASIAINTKAGGIMISNIGPTLAGISGISITAADETFNLNYSARDEYAYSMSGASLRTGSNITWGWTESLQPVVSALTWR